MSLATSLPSTTTDAVRELRLTMRGPALVESDHEYDSVRRIWNGTVDRRPAVIARCVDDLDVMAAVRCARRYGLPLSVLGGGHDWAGRALRDGGLVIDLGAMRRVRVDPETATASVQGAARAGEVLAAARPHGLAPVTGVINKVGLTGLTLGGGYGLLGGRHGLASDNLISADVVLADSGKVTASETENPDLYWALRGGGGNFGIVTEARFRLHPVSTVQAGLLLFPLSQAAAVLHRYQELISAAPDDLTIMAGFFGGPDGVPLLFLLPVWCGDAREAEPWVARVRGLGTPVSGQVDVMSYPDVLSLFDPSIVDGRHNEMRTRWVPALTDDAIDIIVDAMSRVTSPFTGLFLHNFHGAATRVAPADTAFALRRDHLLVEICAAWEPATCDDGGAAHRHWARDLSADLAQHALPGGYPNLLGTDEQERVTVAFGPNAARLLAVADRYDPDGVFNAVASVRPDTAALGQNGHAPGHNGTCPTVETIRFKLRDGVRDAEFRVLNQRVQDEYMALRPGFLSRQTSQSADGEYLVVVHWASEEDARATMGSFFSAPETQGFLGAVDTGTVESGSYALVPGPRV
ncbi:FAD-binding oxidoreductase [Actinophytocola algeriensis]|uniref:FAD/FMN-containing dehydrogenase n=1 Tax=Actinophytocola algeriensis TaxID=1768010 RepID=A0A7W7VFW3_9PSEU|nr:FAD-binding oxidoreductase [Actinophytocola algeriensis]MBB4908430.1 FAD/FMN-containing dehydrogenase [Actinophytocola algeriensis]MBE1475183.1 FAD/FMN-containing dehydrogenase [Actinophytocola algeriensis]